MGSFRYGPFLRSRNAIRAWMLALALLAPVGSVAGAAGLIPFEAQPALHIQYRPDQYRPDQYRQDEYRQDQYRQDQYRQDQYDRPPQDQYGSGQRRYDDRQGRSGQQGGERGGSYQQSCEAIQQQGSILSAVCGDGRGHRYESSIDVNRCGRSDIGNSRGYLQCGRIRASGRPVD